MTLPLCTPRANPYLFGHETAKQRFLKALAADRLHPAWLLLGPSGVGKATLAWHLARRLLAPHDAPEQADDPSSPLFRTIAKGAHADLWALEAEAGRGGGLAEIAVARVREVIARLHATAYGHRRVLVVDPVDALNRSAVNTLLKLLEEPPAGLVCLLVAHRPQLIPPTLASRCLRLRLQALSPETTERALAALLPAQSPMERARLVAFCEGRPGLAVACADGRLFELYDRLLAWLEAAGPIGALLELVSAFEELSRQSGLTITTVPALLVRRMVDLRLGRGISVELVSHEQQRLSALTSRTSLAALASLWEKLDALPRQIESRHLDPGQALLGMLDALSRRLAEPPPRS